MMGARVSLRILANALIIGTTSLLMVGTTLSLNQNTIVLTCGRTAAKPPVARPAKAALALFMASLTSSAPRTVSVDMDVTVALGFRRQLVQCITPRRQAWAAIPCPHHQTAFALLLLLRDGSSTREIALVIRRNCSSGSKSLMSTRASPISSKPSATGPVPLRTASKRPLLKVCIPFSKTQCWCRPAVGRSQASEGLQRRCRAGRHLPDSVSSRQEVADKLRAYGDPSNGDPRHTERRRPSDLADLTHAGFERPRRSRQRSSGQAWSCRPPAPLSPGLPLHLLL